MLWFSKLDPSLIAVLLTIVLSIITTIGGFLYTWRRDARTRQWQLEDAANSLKKANDLALKVVDDAAHLAEKVHSTSQLLVNKVTENTEVSTNAARDAKSAFTEANSVNNKIANLNTSILELYRIVTEHISTARGRRKEDDK